MASRAPGKALPLHRSSCSCRTGSSLSPSSPTKAQSCSPPSCNQPSQPSSRDQSDQRPPNASLQQSLLISSGLLSALGHPLHLSRCIKGRSRCQRRSAAPARPSPVLTRKCTLTISSVSELGAALGILSSTAGSFHLQGVTPEISVLPAQAWHTHQYLQSFVQPSEAESFARLPNTQEAEVTPRP